MTNYRELNVFKLIIAIFFILETAFFFGYTASIFFFFLFFSIIYLFFSSFTSFVSILEVKAEMTQIVSEFYSIIYFSKYKKNILLFLFFYNILFKNLLFHYYNFFNSYLSSLFFYNNLSFIFKDYFLNKLFN